MLEFNNEHKSINGSLKNQKNKVKIRNFILGGVVVASIFLFSGCVKNVECNIIGPHAHKYVSELSYDKYMISEKEHEGKWVRTDDYISISKNMEELIEFENKNGLYRISLNEDNIAETVSSHIDTVEYRYQYRWLQPIPSTKKVGKSTVTTYSFHTRKGHSWTDNPEKKQLTGEERVVHHVYYGYKIEKDENGKMKLVKSEMVDSLDELSADYEYIKKDFFKKVYLNNKDMEIDYEDGPEEDKKLNKKQQADYERQLEREISKSR